MSDFTASATRLAGFAGAALGWHPDAFWRATPAELATVVAAASGAAGVVTPPPPDAIAALQRAFPDG